MRAWGIALGIIGGILSLIASVLVVFLTELACAYGSWNSCSNDGIPINHYISIFVFLLSFTNIPCTKLSSALIVIVSGIGLFAVDGWLDGVW